MRSLAGLLHGANEEGTGGARQIFEVFAAQPPGRLESRIGIVWNRIGHECDTGHLGSELNQTPWHVIIGCNNDQAGIAMPLYPARRLLRISSSIQRCEAEIDAAIEQRASVQHAL